MHRHTGACSQDLLVALCLGALSALSVSAFSVVPSNPLSKQLQQRSMVVRGGPQSPNRFEGSQSSSSSSSLSSSSYSKVVLEAIDELFPPQGLDQRMALSRKDGYWPFINVGDEPPQELVYGEFDTQFFATILHRAKQVLQSSAN
jgi:hypothetical protein